MGEKKAGEGGEAAATWLQAPKALGGVLAPGLGIPVPWVPVQGVTIDPGPSASADQETLSGSVSPAPG